MPRPLYRYTEVARALLTVQCTDNEVSTDKFCTDSESDKGRGPYYRYSTDNETLVYVDSILTGYCQRLLSYCCQRFR